MGERPEKGFCNCGAVVTDKDDFVWVMVEEPSLGFWYPRCKSCREKPSTDLTAV